MGFYSVVFLASPLSVNRIVSVTLRGKHGFSDKTYSATDYNSIDEHTVFTRLNASVFIKF